MTKDEMLSKIGKSKSTEQEYLIKLLKFRGFLLEQDNCGTYYLSDNSHSLDTKHLEELLKKYQFGGLREGKIILCDEINASLFEEEFSENIRIEIDPTNNFRDWYYFRQREHGYKAPVLWLEPFIARYIKAISACSVVTRGSCDGNHHGENKMFIQMDGKGNIPWHKLICDKCLVGKFDIKWSENRTDIYFRKQTKYQTYYELNQAAEFLYENRKTIREIKRIALKDMTRSFLEKHTDEEIEELFVKKATKLFEEML